MGKLVIKKSYYYMAFNFAKSYRAWWTQSCCGPKYGGNEEAIEGEPTDLIKTKPKKNIKRANELGLYL